MCQVACQNLNQNPRTLLPKFFGLYCVQSGGKNIRVVVMNNVLPRVVRMHLKYDLKGSTYKRRASKKEREKARPTFKDLDFMQDLLEGLMLDQDTYSALVKTLQRDCLVLESFKIMDYSLLLGVHNMDQAERERQMEGSQGDSDKKRPMAQQKALYSTAMESIQGGAARGESIDTDDTMGGIPAVNGKGERLLLYIGIIDILQSYRLIKKLEHTWKALVHDGVECSSVHTETETLRTPEHIKMGGIPAVNGKGERLLLYIGIIDILQSYRLIKKLEHTWKALVHDGLASDRDENIYDLRGARSFPTLEDEGRPDLLPCTPPSFEEATTASIATTLSSTTSLSIPERSPSDTSEHPRYRRHTQSVSHDGRTQEELRVREEDQQTITVEVEVKRHDSEPTISALQPEPEPRMGGIPAVNGKGERLLLYIGIIDILQSYRLIKKLEHTWKALVHDGPAWPPTGTENIYDLRGARSFPTLEDEGRPDLLPCTPPSFEEATTASIATTLSSTTSLSIPERSPSDTSEHPRYRRHTQSVSHDGRTQEELRVREEDQQTITVEVEVKRHDSEPTISALQPEPEPRDVQEVGGDTAATTASSSHLPSPAPQASSSSPPAAGSSPSSPGAAEAAAAASSPLDDPTSPQVAVAVVEADQASQMSSSGCTSQASVDDDDDVPITDFVR
ncbi:hypothetical protein CRUP_021988, partial [Coryphaenoides rupestris]